MARKESSNAYVGRELKNNAFEIGHLSDYMARVKGELKLISKYASMVTTQAEQVLKAQSDLLDELNNMSDFGFRQTLEVRTLGCTRRFNPLPLAPHQITGT